MSQLPTNPYDGASSYGGGQSAYPQYPGFNDAPVPTVRKISEAFRDNAVPWVLSALIYILLAVVLDKATANVLAFDVPLSGSALDLHYSPLSTVLGFVVSLMVGVNFYRNAIFAIDGRALRIKDFFSFQFLGYYLLTSIVVGFLTVVGMMLLIIPGLVFAYFAYWAVLTTVDYRETERGPIASIKRSIDLAKNNVGKTFVVIGISILVGIVLGFLVGVLSAFIPVGESILSTAVTPFIALFFAYYYRLSQENLGQLNPSGTSEPFPS